MNLRLENGDHRSALEAAAAYENLETLKYLIEAGADVATFGVAALKAARNPMGAGKANEAVVKALIEAGAKDATESVVVG